MSSLVEPLLSGVNTKLAVIKIIRLEHKSKPSQMQAELRGLNYTESQTETAYGLDEPS